MDVTPNLGLQKPAVLGDPDVWGQALNGNSDTLDTTIKTAQTNIAAKVPLAGGTMTGPLILSADPAGTAPLQATTKNYVDTVDNLKANIHGDTFTGPLILYADPAAALEAATKRYVDTKLPLIGGTLTGPLLLAADPTAALGAATKQYVDALGTSAAGAYLKLIGGTLTGTLTLSSSLGLVVPGPAGTSRTIAFRTSPSAARWNIGMDNAAETGTGNAGSNFAIYASADSGFPQGTWLTINRATGEVGMPGGSITLNTGGAQLSALADGSTVFRGNAGALTFNTSGDAGLVRYSDGAGSLFFGGATQFYAAGGAFQIINSGFVTVFNADGTVTLPKDPTAPLGAATKQYVDALGTSVSGAYLKLTGGTLTGLLTLSNATGVGQILTLAAPPSKYRMVNFNSLGASSPARWSIGAGPATESGGNVGSDFLFMASSDTGFPQGTWLTIARVNGAITMPGPVTMSGAVGIQNTLTMGTNTAAQAINLNGAAGNIRILRWQTAGVARMQWQLNGNAESGSNAGSDFNLVPFDDTGTQLPNAITVIRATGATVFGNNVTVNGSATLGNLSVPVGTATLTGGTFTGTYAGVHSYSGALTFNGAPNTFNGSVALAGGGSINGTWGGNPTFSGNSTFSGNLIFSGASVTAGINTAVTPLIINGPVATNRILRFTTAGVNRMQITCNTNPEAGSNSGSDFALVTFDDGGAVLGTALAIFRASSAAVFGASVQAATIFKVGANQVVTARQTGWGVASGGSRAALNGATATLAQTSAAVAQLIADLTAHGLIGP
jgi:hypothetical protein